MTDPGMIAWAQVVLLNDHPLRSDLVQALRIMTTVHPQVYRPRLARALCVLVDGFSPATPPSAAEPFLLEAAEHLHTWAAAVLRTGSATAEITRRRSPDAGPDWDLLALSAALETAGRRDAALAAVEALVALDRSRRDAPRSRVALALLRQAALLERRERGPAAASLRDEAHRLLTSDPAPPRSNSLATLLTSAAPLPEQRPAPAPNRTPIRH
ncbi:hypothetical protein ACFFX1_27245 [Dactylosporangium sucinum]|uniref:Uncharacterized protein n=1 Tax=Dactylosporangium sucinum TaxID=1424081 RepID=A0A917WIG6_9ACTN|nr:hypothetical protein [Dactylosporangium sucinum]GGM06626.1 hypothetical protein GCM10007977_004650 [Dactylosporangium sucinum]